MTNQFGLFTAWIGKGTPLVETFSSINWAQSDLHLLVECDINGGGQPVAMGVTPIMSVPYALYAAESAHDIDTILPNGVVVLRNGQTFTLPILTGPTGPQDPIGNTGATGNIGVTGATGATGATGLVSGWGSFEQTATVSTNLNSDFTVASYTLPGNATTSSVFWITIQADIWADPADTEGVYYKFDCLTTGEIFQGTPNMDYHQGDKPHLVTCTVLRTFPAGVNPSVRMIIKAGTSLNPVYANNRKIDFLEIK